MGAFLPHRRRHPIASTLDLNDPDVVLTVGSHFFFLQITLPGIMWCQYDGCLAAVEMEHHRFFEYAPAAQL